MMNIVAGKKVDDAFPVGGEEGEEEGEGSESGEGGAESGGGETGEGGQAGIVSSVKHCCQTASQPHGAKFCPLTLHDNEVEIVSLVTSDESPQRFKLLLLRRRSPK